MNPSPRFLKFGIIVGIAWLLYALPVVLGPRLRRAFPSADSSLEMDLSGDRPASEAPVPEKLRNFGRASEEYNSSEAAAPVAAPVEWDKIAEGMNINPPRLTRRDHLSTSYPLFRRCTTEGRLPTRGLTRVEEWVNYFKYRYPEPDQGDFRVDLEGAPSPFTPGHYLLKVSLQGRTVARSQRKPTHLVFLVNTSGSMASADKLPLAQKSMKLLVDGLNETDTVALVTYADSVRDVLPPTPASQRDTLFAAIDSLSARGGTAMGSGLELAYRYAVRQVSPRSVSRVIVLTDSDTQLVPNQTAQQMLESVRGHVQEGVTLSTIGFGKGSYHYHDGLMEHLADQGNGNCFYIDSEGEARRVFQERLASTLEVIAQDVKVQVEFDPENVRGYRLLGYESRSFADKDLRDDKMNVEEMGAGQTLTALYEVGLQGEGERVVTVHVRARQPGSSEASEQRFSLTRSQLHPLLSEASSNLRFAAAVAGTAAILSGSVQGQPWSLVTTESLAKEAVDGQSDRAEFLELLRAVREHRARSGPQ